MANNDVVTSNENLKRQGNLKPYTTVYVMSLDTGKPFVFDVSSNILDRLERQKYSVSQEQAPLLGNSVEELVENFEFSLFPTFGEVLKIFFQNGFTNELITKILCDFGAGELFIQELL